MLATPQNEVLFTTVRLPDKKYEDALDMMANFCYYVWKTGALDHLLILTTDNGTWWRLHNAGMPVYLDRAFPARPEYLNGDGNVKFSPNRVFDVQKHWWGWWIIENGFRAAYMDGDAVTIQDPFLAFQDAEYDVQGLSDWVTAKLPQPGDLLAGGCNLYFWIEDPLSILKHTLSNSAPPFHAKETSLREFWRFPRQVQKLYAMNPCQSTGTWYLQPTAAARAFMRAMARRVLQEPHHWDQTAWNEVILPFLWGNGEDAPQLRYRLLPHRSYANANVVDRRREEGLPLDLVVLHSGYLHGQEKSAAYQRLGYWHPERWAPIGQEYAQGRPGGLGAGGSGLGSLLRRFGAGSALRPASGFGALWTDKATLLGLLCLALVALVAAVRLSRDRRRARGLAKRGLAC
ncbi:hypothetical protein QBZ16_001128 [Prototheca wickerhamii]|uniref:Nucleotide-diphospho-sugar transferase domain-containing protein n=1 Tax=Prototheca wickerhamii TaxID=3111 RepID=A0AAD9IEU5_PROWI|nr:hypothetical protein QBZ16_001128 [Prototheca wickerhamii]